MIKLNTTNNYEILIDIASVKSMKDYTEVEDTNGRAYFVEESLQQIEHMMLRDQFAMSALPLTISNFTLAYAIADAMLEERGP